MMFAQVQTILSTNSQYLRVSKLRLKHLNLLLFQSNELVGECMALLASGSEHTMTVSARAILAVDSCVVALGEPLSPRWTRCQFALSDSYGSVGAWPVAFPL